VAEPVTTLLRIRAAIEEWARDHRHPFGTVNEHAVEERAALAERIDRALFELPEDQEQALEQWAAHEAAARERTRAALAELEAEARRLLDFLVEPADREGACWPVFENSVYVVEFPRIAALLREPGEERDRG